MSVFATHGWTCEQCKDYLSRHSTLPQKLATVLSLKSESQKSCEDFDSKIQEAKEFIERVARKLDCDNVNFYIQFEVPADPLTDSERAVHRALLPEFLRSRDFMLSNELTVALSKMCKKFTLEEISAAVKADHEI